MKSPWAGEAVLESSRNNLHASMPQQGVREAMAITSGQAGSWFPCPLQEKVAPGNLLPLPGHNRKRRGCAGPAWAGVAAELIDFSHGPDLLLAPEEKSFQEGFFSLELKGRQIII